MENTDDSDFQRISAANFNKLSTSLTKAGYKDGRSDGTDAVFQHGFDTGYADGLKTAFEIAKWKAIRNAMPREAKEFESFAGKHSILDADEKDHHLFQQNPTKSVDEISELQQNYANNTAKTLNTDFEGIKRFLEYFLKEFYFIHFSMADNSNLNFHLT